MRRYLIVALFVAVSVFGCSGNTKSLQTPANVSTVSVASERLDDDIRNEYLPSLHAACNSSHIDKELIRKLVAEGADVNEEAQIDRRGSIYLTPLMIACARSDIDVEAVKLLIELGADINKTAGRIGLFVPENEKKYQGKSALMIASNRSEIDEDAIRVLAAAGADLNARSNDDFKHMSALMLACNRSEIDDEAIKLMIELGADVNLGNHNNDNSAMIATDRLNADIQAVHILLDAGTDVNQIANNGTVLLMGGGVLNSLELTEKIVDMGANIHYLSPKHDKGMNLLGNAAAYGSEDVVQYYIDNGLDVNQTFGDGQSIIMQATWGNTLNVVKRLVKAGADLDVKSKNGWTNLIYACLVKSKEADYRKIDRPQLDVVKYLLKSGANINDETTDGENAFHLLVQSNEDVTDIVKLLLDKGAAVNHRTKYGITPLMKARNPKVVQYLLDNGADINAIDREQRNALHWAIYGSRLEAAQILLDSGIDRNAKDQDGEDVRECANTAEAIELLYKNGYRFNDVWTKMDDYTYILNDANHDYMKSKLLLTMLKVGGGSDNPDIGSMIISYISRSDNIPVHADEIIDEIVRRNPNVLNEPAENGVNHLTEILMNRPYSNFSAVLVKHGAKPKTKEGESPFAVIFRTSWVSTSLVKAMIESGEDINVMINSNWSDRPVPVLIMIVKNAPEAVKDALDAGADPNIADEDGVTPLMAVRDNVDVVKALLRAGANPNAREKNGYSVLKNYAHFGTPAMVKALLDAGAVVDENIIDYVENEQIAELLRNSGKIRYKLDNLLHLDEITEDMINEVIAGGDDLNEPLDEYNRTLLYFACMNSQADKIKFIAQTRSGSECCCEIRYRRRNDTFYGGREAKFDFKYNGY